MCRLLGVIANKPVDLEFSLGRFKEFSVNNPDGWGIGWYEDNKAMVFKQGLSADDRESKLPQLSKEVISEIIIAHVRKGTGAEPAERNSHPFICNNWIFAHNGSVDREYVSNLLIDKYRTKLTGETDSEAFFYLIIQSIEEHNNIINGIKSALKEVIKHKYTGLNFLLSNGQNLYSFRYSSCYRDYYSLYSLKRSPSESGPLEFESQETRALLYSKSLKGESAVLVCSEKLTKENWESLRPGNLVIVTPELNVKEVEIF